jgi:hypothetical protein
MPMNDRIGHLINVLLRGTADRLLQWQPTADEKAFRLTSKSANVRLEMSAHFDPEAQEEYTVRTLSVLNDKGRVIEEWSPDTPAEAQQFDELYNLARRSAYKTDEVLHKLINELKMQTQG